MQLLALFTFLASMGLISAEAGRALDPLSATTHQFASPPPTPDERIITGPGFHCAEDSSEFSCSLNFTFLHSGYFQIVNDPTEVATASTAMQDNLRALGIPAEIGECQWMGLVAVGTASGNFSYGALCSVKIGQEPPRSFMICNPRYGGITLVELDVYGGEAEDIELFIRPACF